jgi:hypothetical protein
MMDDKRNLTVTPDRQRRAYKAPEVRFLGRVQDLTLSGGASPATDAAHVPTKAVGT